MTRVLKVKVGSKWYTVEVEDLTTVPIRVLVDGEPVEVDIDGMAGTSEQLEVQTTDSPQMDPTPAHLSQAKSVTGEVSHTIRAPMPGVIISVGHIIGDHIAVGDEACVLEAMKMQQSIRSDGAGTVARILIQPGQQVRGGEALIELS
ncbi:MAG: acetyl-CoA carboxylase biotin carboxyl carrier protein subunit [Chloroflexi bacterium]|nr:acetyl-CoA carboxylase biotin carboxyl carrier protein subunit [Chloroflexota bacterium]MDA1228925.1 acetyl-CoA carboxylase biotin carboxyl carrier protein subunit [Chloroflexota bacterium]